jgi:hypothetical protein
MPFVVGVTMRPHGPNPRRQRWRSVDGEVTLVSEGHWRKFDTTN